jgi:serine/threonine protein kinase
VKSYQILELLGAGGMGVVYLAVQERPDRVVALKVIRPDRLDGLPPAQRRETIQRFVTEARAAARLGHESIVPVFEVGEMQGRPFYSMRYVEGASLADLIADGPLEPRRAAAYLVRVARAVHEAHRHAILHRDLKPENVLVESATDRVFVADFGLAKLAQEGHEGTRTGAVMGTPPYMSPAQATAVILTATLLLVVAVASVLFADFYAAAAARTAADAKTLREKQKALDDEVEKVREESERRHALADGRPQPGIQPRRRAGSD